MLERVIMSVYISVLERVIMSVYFSVLEHVFMSVIGTESKRLRSMTPLFYLKLKQIWELTYLL